MSFLLMFTQENVGYIYLKLKVTHLIYSKSIKPLLKRKQGNTSEPLEQTMEESLKLSDLRISTSQQESRDSRPCHITLNKMELLRGKSKTIHEVAKAMMFDQDMPNYLWEEATSTALYIQNRFPHAILKDKTPKEVFLGIKHEVGNLRIFGCPIYIHVPKEKTTNMEPSGKKGVIRNPFQVFDSSDTSSWKFGSDGFLEEPLVVLDP
jgi:hypothetical protein